MESSPGNTSYPPLFRAPISSPAATAGSPAPSPGLAAADIPAVDFHDLSGERLGEACGDWGLFRIANHGVPADLSAQLHAAGRALLALPFEAKQAGLTPPAAYFWGHPALTPSPATLNWVEGLHVQLAQLHQAAGPDETIQGYSSFRCLADEYGQHMARITRKLFDTLGLNLKLNSNQQASYLSDSDGMLRVYRYPCCTAASHYFGMDAHTDSSVMSILDQDGVGGLQILHNNQWLDVAPVPDTLVVNLGDMMQAISNDMYKSVEHRVLANSTKDRISVCYFAFPLEDGVIVSSNYKPFTYKEFRAKVQEDVRDSGFKVGLERFRTRRRS